MDLTKNVNEIITDMANAIDNTASYTNRLQRNKAYSVGDIAYSPNLPSWAYLECTTAGTTGETEPDFSTVVTKKTIVILSKFAVLDGACEWRLRDTRCKYEVGDIIPKVGKPKDYEYLILADGGGFDEAYTQLAKVFTDGNVPNLTDGRFLEGGVTAGQVKGAGLPNITGMLGNIYTFNDQITTKGALKEKVLDLGNQHTPYPNTKKMVRKLNIILTLPTLTTSMVPLIQYNLNHTQYNIIYVMEGDRYYDRNTRWQCEV